MKNTSVSLLMLNKIDYIEMEFYLGHKTQQSTVKQISQQLANEMTRAKIELVVGQLANITVKPA